MSDVFGIQWEADDHAGVWAGYGGNRMGCYTKAQLRAFHPRTPGHIAGEIPAAQADADNLPAVRQRGGYNRLTHTVIGYLRCGEGRYVALVAYVLPKRLLSIAAIVICAALLSAVVFLRNAPALHPVSFQAPAASVASIETDPRAIPAGRAASAVPGEADPQNINTQFKGFAKASVDFQTRQLKATLENPAGNSCYFVISILVSGSTVYQSKMLPPGQRIEAPVFNQSLAKGSYQATIQYRCYHVTPRKEINGAQFKTELVVQ